MSTPPDIEKQYANVLAEYRFQVQLNWDRTKHYFTFNTALLGAAVALYKLDESWPARAGVSALLLIAATNSIHDAFAVGRGHEYYRSHRADRDPHRARVNTDATRIRRGLWSLRLGADEALCKTDRTFRDPVSARWR